MFHVKNRHIHGDNHQRRHARGDSWLGGERGRGLGPGPGHGMHHERGGRIARMFAHGDLHLVTLHLIEAKPRHGYELIKAIEEQLGGAYSPSPGTIYPALTMLEEQGYVIPVPGEGAKKLFAITPEGKAYLEENRVMLDAILARMESIRGAHGEGSAPQIVRAVENLKLSLRLRLGRGELNDEAIRLIAEALDRAAGEIERS